MDFKNFISTIQTWLATPQWGVPRWVWALVVAGAAYAVMPKKRAKYKR